MSLISFPSQLDLNTTRTKSRNEISVSLQEDGTRHKRTGLRLTTECKNKQIKTGQSELNPEIECSEQVIKPGF